jgi:hypothetical protein
MRQRIDYSKSNKISLKAYPNLKSLTNAPKYFRPETLTQNNIYKTMIWFQFL